MPSELPAWYSVDNIGLQPNIPISDHDKKVSNWCEGVYSEARDELERHEEIVAMDRYIRYLTGAQWTERRPSYKSSPIANRMFINLIQLVSYLTDIRQSFEVRSNNRSYDGHADILNKIIKSWMLDEDVDTTLAMIIIHASLCIGYARLTWNPDLHGNEGDMELTACGALDVIPIRPGHNLQKSIGVIYRMPKPLSWFKEKYPTKGSFVPADREYSQFLAQGSNSGTASTQLGRSAQLLSPQMRRLFGRGTSQSTESMIPQALYREFWIRDEQRNTSDQVVYVGNPDREYGYAVKPGARLYPRGRLIIMGGPITLFDGPNPFWHGQFPFAALRFNRVPWQWPGISEFRNQIPLQDVMNSVLAGILDTVKRAVNPPLLAPDNAFGLATKRALDPNMPGAKLFYNPSSVFQPTYAQPAQLPSFVFQVLQWAEQELSDQAGFIDLSSVSRKGIVPAADTLEQMKEGQQTLVRLKVRYIESFFKDIGSQFIPNVYQFYTLGRRIQMLGEDGKTWEDFDIEPGTMVPAGVPKEEHWRSFRFMVQPGSLLKSARVPYQMLMLNLRRMGDMDRENLFKALDLEGLIDSSKKNLEAEGKDILMQAVRQKMAGTAGGGNVSPQAIQALTEGPTAEPAPSPVM